MNIPDPMPPIIGRGPVARATQILAEKINGLIACIESLQPRSTYKSRTTHSPIGVSHEPVAGSGDEGNTSGGAARWA